MTRTRGSTSHFGRGTANKENAMAKKVKVKGSMCKGCGKGMTKCSCGCK